jgi:hypothetical protein
VAFFSLKMVLRANGLDWKPGHEEAEQRLWRLAETSPAQRDQMLEELSIWIRQSCTPLSG